MGEKEEYEMYLGEKNMGWREDLVKWKAQNTGVTGFRKIQVYKSSKNYSAFPNVVKFSKKMTKFLGFSNSFPR